MLLEKLQNNKQTITKLYNSISVHEGKLCNFANWNYYLYKTTDSTQIYLRRNKLVSKIFNFGKKLNEVKKDFDKMVDNMTPKPKQKPISYRRSSDGNILCD